ncbi:cell division protein FtsQ/DivIB [Arthrobacter castelli]|uniref:cell division protein FtsQ/DivIB n=1 Tax=Arthrobacter castelli TaxID=271431 RepID=UPI00041EC8A6|nr:cell division protein FtsQ/DivIB [Arthrobacter castelli]
MTKETETDTSGSVVEMPRPAWRRRRRNWLIGGGTAAVLVAALIAAVIFTPMFAVRTLTIDGTKLATDKTIRKQLEPVMGVPLPQVTTSEVHSLLDDVPQVADVDIEAHPPSELVVHVQERIPVAVIKKGGKFALIDKTGTELASVKDRSKVQLPLIEGTSGQVGEEIFRTTTEVLASLPASIRSKLEHASAESIDSVVLTLENGKKVIWGNATKNQLKAEVLQVLLEEAGKKDTETGAAPIRVYDVSSPTRPVTR